MTEKRGKEQKGSTEKTLYQLGLAAILVVASASFSIWYFKIPLTGPLFACPVHTLTGFFCPGCGGTRAFSYLFHGKFLSSLICHPLVLYGTAVFAVFMVSHTLEIFSRGKIRGMTYRHIYIKIAVVLLILNMLVKNAAWFFFGLDLTRWAGSL